MKKNVIERAKEFQASIMDAAHYYLSRPENKAVLQKAEKPLDFVAKVLKGIQIPLKHPETDLNDFNMKVERKDEAIMVSMDEKAAEAASKHITPMIKKGIKPELSDYELNRLEQNAIQTAAGLTLENDPERVVQNMMQQVIAGAYMLSKCRLEKEGVMEVNLSSEPGQEAVKEIVSLVAKDVEQQSEKAPEPIMENEINLTIKPPMPTP